MAATAGDVAVSYSLTNDQLTLHEPVLVAFVVRNNLAHPINLDLGEDHKSGFLLTLTRPDRARIKLPKYSAEGLYETGKLSLKPGQIYEQKLLLNEWDDFNEVGEYQVEINFNNPVEVEGGSRVKTSSRGLLKLEIGPRNPAVLMQRCAELADKVEKAPSYAEAVEPARVLSYVKDEAAVPYLARIIEANKLAEGNLLAAEIAIQGLGRVANDDAIDILFSLLQRPSEDVPTPVGDIPILAGHALVNIYQESSDPKFKEKLKQRIKRAVPESNLKGE